jgi:hypothetical protein
MAFCSLLTTRGIFKEVTVGFLVVGHTHEDIDAYFSYMSKLLKQKNIVRCSAIEGILRRHHSCGLILMLEEVAHNWHLGYLGALGLLGAIRYLGAKGLLSLYVDVWRLIFLKLSLPRDGVSGCFAPCNSILYVRSFFKNGTDLTVFTSEFCLFYYFKRSV